MTSDKKYRIGLIGHPIAHSRSPKLFRETFAERPDVLSRYSYDLIEETDFEAAYGRFLADYLAVNVTAPFKTLAFEAAGIHSEEACLCGATNLLVKEIVTGVAAAGNRLSGQEHGQWIVKAYNTDCLAVKKILQDNGFRSGDTAYVYGCGGAGRAAAVAGLLLGMNVRIYNRTRSTSEAFVESLRGENCPLPEICGLSHPVTDNCTSSDSRTVLIYTLPIAPEEALDEAQLATFREQLAVSTVLEANYKDPHLSSCAPHYISGLEWLRLQAIATYEIVIK